MPTICTLFFYLFVLIYSKVIKTIFAEVIVMPTYDFQCEKCEHKFSVFTSIAQKDKVVCPKCQSKEVKQLFTGFIINTTGYNDMQ